MMNTPKISILVPVYNVEKYLQRCVDSVLAQDFTDWEMILVDDGSPDRCPQICDEYAQQDERIKVVHQKNGGAHAARKAGFEHSQGKYLVFLDPDDYLLPKALSSLYAIAIEGKYDIVKGANLRVRNNGTSSIEAPILSGKEIIEEENYLFALLSYHILPYLWGGIYRKTLFSEETFKSAINIPIGEDWITNQSIWRSVKRYATINNVVYAYYINNSSIMQTRVLSHEYHESFRKMMLQIATGASSKNMQAIERDRIMVHIKCFFTPEIGWDNTWYNIIYEYVKDDNNFKKLSQNNDKKFLKFIRSRTLFRLYTFVYRVLFLSIKLHGRKRSVL